MTVVAQGSGVLESIQRPKSVFQRNLNLVRELSITSFKLKYTGSALGYVWSLAKPLMYFGIMYLVFSLLLRVGKDDVLGRVTSAIGLDNSCPGEATASAQQGKPSVLRPLRSSGSE